MRYIAYNLLLLLAAPLGALYLVASSRHRPLLRRFYPVLSPHIGDSPLWVHAASVGEVNVAMGLIQAFKKKAPTIPVVLTVSTLSGLRLARMRAPAITVAFVPFDLIISVRSFVRRMRPRQLVIIETELWPNLLRETRRSGADVMIVNARLSAELFPRYARFRYVLPPLFSYVNFVGAQDETYAERFRRLGVPDSYVAVTGNMKCDTALAEYQPETLLALRRENGFQPHDVLLIFGSTRPGDEQLAADCWRHIKERFPQTRLVIAPRHLERVDAALKPFEGEAVLRRSEVKSGKSNPKARVFFLDTFGELMQFYAASTVAVIGGSFFPGVGGHNPLESAAAGVATVFGPHMEDFADAAGMLLAQEGAVQVERPEALQSLLCTLLETPAVRERIACTGREVVLANRGAVERNVAAILRHKNGASS